MFHKSLVPSVLLLSIAALSAMTSTAQAQDVDVNFNGSVSKVCQFVGTPTDGTLAANSAVLPTKLSSKGAGTAGIVKLQCNSPATVSAGVPESTGADTFAFAAVEQTLTANSNTGTTIPVTVGATNNIQVNLTLDNQGAIIPPGNYAYKVKVTAVAN